MLVRQVITKILVSMLISIVIFYPFNPRYIIYMLVVGGIWGVLLLNYKLTANSRFFASAIIFSTANLLSLIFMKLLVHQTLHKDWVNIAVCAFYILALGVLGLICFYNERRRKPSQIEAAALFNRRKYDLERVQKYINTVDVVGINGIWGSGKSFLVAQLKEQLNASGKYIFIDVDLLSCNLDELQAMLLNEMERVLYERKIVPTHSVRLKRMLQEKAVLQSLYMLLMQDDMSYSEALNGFMQEISLLDETIVIVYEDIDRISNADIIKKIFSISEKLAGKQVKIIYQYEETNLSKLGLDRAYLEKYIPFIVNLTPIKFVEILEYTLKDEKIDERFLASEDFKDLTFPVHTGYYIKKTLGISLEAYIRMDHVAIRKVKIFIKELAMILEEKELYNQKEYKQTVLNFYFIKHFFPELYNQFNLEEGLLDTIKFAYEKEHYSILELIAMGNFHKENSGEAKLSPDQIKELFDIAENREKLLLLILFKYDLEIEDIHRNFHEIVNEPTQNIRKKASNEKKDRLIWNLLCNGKSEYTDYETAAYKLVTEVLSKPEDEQNKAYEEFQKEMYHGKHEKKDNATIFRLGIPSFISLSQAFRGSNIAAKDWKRFISFYFAYTKKDTIDIELIQILNYCNIGTREVYLDILKRFNGLKIVGNMNMEKGYKRFLKKYLKDLSSIGYVNTHEVWMLDVPDTAALTLRDIEGATKHIRHDISEMRGRIDIEVIRAELDTIDKFIDKNIEIIKAKQSLKVKEPGVHSTMSSRYVNQETFDRLAELQRTVDKAHFMRELEISYQNGDISAYEVDKLLA